MKKPNPDLDHWELTHFIEAASELKLLQPDTSNVARLARNLCTQPDAPSQLATR
jgi:hypothetical protein